MKQRRVPTALAFILALLLGFPLIGFEAAAPAQAQGLSISFNYFHRELSPYGNWVDVGNYGPCWRPSRLASSWRPYYTNGRWVYTEYGWTWVSNEPWSQIAYHYGSWYDDSTYGWVWVPGYTWAPSWVTWMYADDYVGWAPISPRYRFGVSRVTYQPVVVGYSDYVFVPANNFTSYNISSAAFPYWRNREIARVCRPATTFSVVNNYVVNRGPDIAVFERHRNLRVRFDQVSGSRIRPQSVRLVRNQRFIEATSPQLNRREGIRLIRDGDRQRSEALADQTRRIREQTNRLRAISRTDRTANLELRRQQNRLERTQRQQQRIQRNEAETLQQHQRQQQRRQQNGAETLQRQQRQQQRRQQDVERIQRQQQRRQQNEAETLQSQQQRRQRNGAETLQRQQRQQQRRQQDVERIQRQQQREQMRQQNNQVERQQRQQQREQFRQQNNQVERQQRQQQREQMRQQNNQVERMQRQQQREQFRQQNNQVERQQRQQQREQRRIERRQAQPQNNSGRRQRRQQ